MRSSLVVDQARGAYGVTRCEFRFKRGLPCFKYGREAVTVRGRVRYYCSVHSRSMRVREAKRRQEEGSEM